MSKKLLMILTLGASMLPVVAHPISRIGGGKVGSLSSQFVADLPGVYLERKTGNEQLKLFQLQTLPLGGKMSAPSSVLLAEIKDHFPEISEFNRDDVQRFLTDLGLKNVTSSFDLEGCVDVYQRSSTDTDQFVLVWGQGRGFQLSFTKDAQARFDAHNLVRSVELFESACSWE